MITKQDLEAALRASYERINAGEGPSDELIDRDELAAFIKQELPLILIACDGLPDEATYMSVLAVGIIAGYEASRT